MRSTRSVAEMDEINRRTYRSAHSRHVYGKAEGWKDEAERLALAHVRDLAGEGPILDIGFGGGRTVPLLRAMSENYVGIDYTPELVTLARQRFPGVDLREMDARKLDFPDNSFRLAVFTYNGIDSAAPEHQESIIREVHRVLQPGGAFVFSSLNSDGPGDTAPPLRISFASPRAMIGSAIFMARVKMLGGIRRIRYRHLNVTR
ncbi:MAG TPA: class I SAM-dependent methyltransferase, partial [Acetobacteraceae bacterium]